MLFYPLYALLFADAGLSTAQISSLFAIWCAVSFAFEVPSGAWADTFSRRRLVASGAVVRAAGFLSWAVWPTYAGFALGFACWAFSSAVSSGAQEALLYDELAAVGAESGYAAVTARAETVAMMSMLAASALATPVLAVGGYGLIASGSVLACLGGAAAALAFPETPRAAQADGDGLRAYLRNLRAGLGEVRRVRLVRRAVVVTAAVACLTALDEYVSLLLHDAGMAVVGVPLAMAVLMGAMALGSAGAERWSGARPGRIGAAVGVAGVCLGAGALAAGAGTLVAGLAGLAPIAAGYGLLQYASVLTWARLQETVTSGARATVLSVAGVGLDTGALVVYGAFGLGSLWVSTAMLSALFAVPIVAIAVMAARWIPAHRPHPAASVGEPEIRSPEGGRDSRVTA